MIRVRSLLTYHAHTCSHGARTPKHACVQHKYAHHPTPRGVLSLQRLASGERKLDPGRSQRAPHGFQPLQQCTQDGSTEERTHAPRAPAATALSLWRKKDGSRESNTRRTDPSRYSTSLLRKERWIQGYKPAHATGSTDAATLRL